MVGLVVAFAALVLGTVAATWQALLANAARRETELSAVHAANPLREGMPRGELREKTTGEAPVRALMQRALQLDEAYDLGAIHGVLIALEALPEAMGGSPQRARKHFDRAVELSRGLSVGPYVTLASTVVVAEQDWQEFQHRLP